jgi:hypothetical protein
MLAQVNMLHSSQFRAFVKRAAALALGLRKRDKKADGWHPFFPIDDVNFAGSQFRWPSNYGGKCIFAIYSSVFV